MDVSSHRMQESVWDIGRDNSPRDQIGQSKLEGIDMLIKGDREKTERAKEAKHRKETR